MTFPKSIRVFLAAPYTQWMDFAAGTVDPCWRFRLEAIRCTLMEMGAEVFSAHHNESWGAQWLDADVCTPVDFAAMLASDVVCAIVGQPPSGGVTVELGWASALGKPTLMVVSPGASRTPLLTGLGTVTAVKQLDEPVSWHRAEIAEIAAQTLTMVGREAEGEPQPQPQPSIRRLAGTARLVEHHLSFCSSQRCRHKPPLTDLATVTGRPRAHDRSSA
jgi:nucleoside 2-deoxyribosyltransferase